VSFLSFGHFSLAFGLNITTWWQLVGMARKDFPAALRIFRGSLTKRFGYIARNIDPALAAPWLAAYDSSIL
jgi:hypothetical protein